MRVPIEVEKDTIHETTYGQVIIRNGMKKYLLFIFRNQRRNCSCDEKCSVQLRYRALFCDSNITEFGMLLHEKWCIIGRRFLKIMRNLKSDKTFN